MTTSTRSTPAPRLEDLASRTPLPSTAFTYGRLHALEDLHAQRSSELADTAWSDAKRTRLRTWLA